MSRETFASWYGWYYRQLCDIVRGVGSTLEKVTAMNQLELQPPPSIPRRSTFCENELRFLKSLSRMRLEPGSLLIELVKDGQNRLDVKAEGHRAACGDAWGARCARSQPR